MPNPTISDVHVNKPLTNISVGYIQDQNNFIASKIFPNIPVTHKSDLYYKFNKEDFMTSQMEERAPGDESAGSGYRLSTDSYLCRVFALHKDVPDQIRANSDTVLQPDREAVEFLTQNALIKRELDWATAYFTATAGWMNNTAGQAGASNMAGGFTQFWNLAASTPIEDLRYAIKVVQKLNGIKPNILVLGASAWYALQDNPDLIDRVRYSGGSNTNPAMITEQAVAAILKLKAIYVMEAVYNTAHEGQGFTGSFVGDKSALLLYAAPAPGIMTPSAGYTFSWTGAYGNGIQGNRISKFRMEPKKSDRVEIEMAYGMKMVGPDLGFFFGTCVQ